MNNINLLLITLLIICYHDIKTHRISDAFTLPGILIGFCFHQHLGIAILGSLTGILGTFFLNSLRIQKLGGGDAKLFAMLGAFTNSPTVLLTMFGAYALIFPLRFLKKRMVVPYSPFISISFIGVIYGT